MKRPLLLILTIYIGHFCHAQQLLKPPAEYYSNLAIADSLSEIKEYTKATQHLNAAFEAFGWRGTRDDRFKAARIFALANNCDSSFKHIERIWKSQYINYLKITADKAFDTLRRFDQIRFDTLIQHIKEVKEQVAPKQNLEWTNYFDSILVEDQVVRKKWKKAADIYGYNSKEAQQY